LAGGHGAGQAHAAVGRRRAGRARLFARLVRAAQHALVVGQAGRAATALARERALRAGGDAAARRAVVALLAAPLRPAVAARHAVAIELAAVVLGRHAVAAILARVAAAGLRRLDSADIALGVAHAAARRHRAVADGRVGAGDHLARHQAVAGHPRSGGAAA